MPAAVIEVFIVGVALLALRGGLAVILPSRTAARAVEVLWPAVALGIGWLLYAGPVALFQPPDLVDDAAMLRDVAAIALAVILAATGAAAPSATADIVLMRRSAVHVLGVVALGTLFSWAGLGAPFPLAFAMAVAAAAGDPSGLTHLPRWSELERATSQLGSGRVFPCWTLVVASLAIPWAALGGGQLQPDVWLVVDVGFRLLAGALLGWVGGGLASWAWQRVDGWPNYAALFTVAVGLLAYGLARWALVAGLVAAYVAAARVGRVVPRGLASGPVWLLLSWGASVWLLVLLGAILAGGALAALRPAGVLVAIGLWGLHLVGALTVGRRRAREAVSTGPGAAAIYVFATAAPLPLVHEGWAVVALLGVGAVMGRCISGLLRDTRVAR